MADDSGHVDSPAQDDYVALAGALRAKLKNMAEAQLAAMRPEEVKLFLDTCQAAYWFEITAHCLDHKIEHDQRCWGD